MKPKKEKKNPDWLDEKTTGAELAHYYSEHLISKIKFVCLKDTQELFFFSNAKGCYIPAKTMIDERAQIDLGKRGTINMLREIKARISNRSYIERPKENSRFLPLLSGIYDTQNQKHFYHSARIMEDGNLIEPKDLSELKKAKKEEGVLLDEPYYNRLVFFTSLNISFKEEATCEKFEKALDEWMKLPDGSINERGKKTLWQLTASLFNREPNNREIHFLIGEPKTGKTTFLELVEELIGKENCSHETFFSLIEDQHSKAELEGKWLNAAGEVKKIQVKSADEFLRLAGGETISAHKKFGQRRTFPQLAKLAFAMNEVPAIDDPTGAFASRLVVTDFCNVFEKKGTPREFISRILDDEERSGIFNRSMEILQEMRKGLDFERMPLREMQEMLEQRSSSCTNFASTQVTPAPENWVLKDLIFPCYLSYCSKEKIAPETEKKFWQLLRSRYGKLFDEHRIKINGIQKFYWKGLKIQGIADSGSPKEDAIIAPIAPVAGIKKSIRDAKANTTTLSEILLKKMPAMDAIPATKSDYPDNSDSTPIVVDEGERL